MSMGYDLQWQASAAPYLAFKDWNEARSDWSFTTFGPASVRPANSPLKHLEKEVQEALAETDPAKKREEIVDCLFLTLDASERAGMSFDDLVTLAQWKLAKNKGRDYGDWRTKDPHQPMEHDRSKD